jgi:hypothetical protein
MNSATQSLSFHHFGAIDESVPAPNGLWALEARSPSEATFDRKVRNYCERRYLDNSSAKFSGCALLHLR